MASAETNDLREQMIDLILTHWATYLFLFWLLVIAIGNLWPRRKAE
jgi:hypothetical protein